MLSDIAIQKNKISISVEKLQVHFKSGIGGDNKIGEAANEMINQLNDLHEIVKKQTVTLEASLMQIDQYQQVRHEKIRYIYQIDPPCQSVTKNSEFMYLLF